MGFLGPRQDEECAVRSESCARNQWSWSRQTLPLCERGLLGEGMLLWLMQEVMLLERSLGAGAMGLHPVRSLER